MVLTRKPLGSLYLCRQLPTYCGTHFASNKSKAQICSDHSIEILANSVFLTLPPKFLFR